MKINLRLAAVCLALMFAGPTLVCAQSQEDLQAALDEMHRVERELALDVDPVPPLREAFEKGFGEVQVATLDKISDAGLQAYFSAADLLAFYSNDPDDLSLMEASFKALESRGLAGPFEAKLMVKEFVALRAFDRARELAARFPDVDVEPLPEVAGIDDEFVGPTVLELHQDGTVSRVPSGVRKEGPYVVVAAHPLCHFSENAVRAIRQDPVVAPLFAGRTLWLMPQDGYMNLEVVRDWNRQFPDYAMRWAYRTSDWPMIKRWATPNFYFYHDGKLVDTVIGWPPEGQREALLKAFEKIGVMPPQAP